MPQPELETTIAARVGKITTEEDKAISLLEGLIEGIVENLNKLATKIEKDEDTYETLENWSDLHFWQQKTDTINI